MQHSTSRPSLPGTYSYAQQDTGSLPRVSGAKSHIFQPPRTPSTSAASSLYLSQSQIPYANNPNNAPIGASRKRSRTDYDSRDESMERITVGRTSSGKWTAAELAGDQATDLSRSVEMTDPGSPMPFVNTQYMLAGGMDTPSQTLESATERADYYLGDPVDMGYRRERTGASRQNTFQDDPDYFHTTDVNGRPRNIMQYEEKRDEEGWNITKLAAGVVGKVWEFCKLSGAAFRGFHAGGGKGYNTDLQPEDSEVFWLEKDESGGKEGTPIPGSWTAVGEEDLDIIPDYLDRHTSDNLNRTPERGNKRRHISTPKEEIAKNWVVVPQNNTPSKPPQPKPLGRFSMPTNASSSRRGILRPSTVTTATSSLPRPALRRPIVSRSSVAATSHAGSPSLNSQKPASFASPRSPGGSKIPVSRSREGSPRKSHHSRMSGSIGGADKPESPAAKEAKKWAAVKRKEEREADESIRRLDAQLKAMIKEGKEALGTKVTVEMEDDEIPSRAERGGDSRMGHGSRASVAGLGTGASVRKWDF